MVGRDLAGGDGGGGGVAGLAAFLVVLQPLEIALSSDLENQPRCRMQMQTEAGLPKYLYLLFDGLVSGLPISGFNLVLQHCLFRQIVVIG